MKTAVKISILTLIAIEICFAKPKLIRKSHEAFDAQNNRRNLPHHWYLTSRENNTDPLGISVPSDLNTSEKIIIAVIDTGFDINHDALKNHLWINSDEIPNNQIDDDGNGYVDDIVGWNFLGSKKGNISYTIKNSKFISATNSNHAEQINYDTREETRKLLKLRGELSESKEKTQLEQFIAKKLKRARKLKEKFLLDLMVFEKAFQTLKLNLSIEEINITELNNIKPEDDVEKLAKETLINFLLTNRDVNYLRTEINRYFIQENFHYNTELDQRKKIIGDDVKDLNHRHYGNNNIIGLNSKHGTQVASVIAGSTKNKKIGIAPELINLMLIKAIPNGDERDKDVINAIKYAVDNGAKIINLSFGKYFSENNHEVSMALSYAESKGVIVTLAAGNDYKNLDLNPSYPSPYINGVKLSNTLLVGSSSPFLNESILSSFSNIGKSIDILAPGENILTAIPNNKYEIADGTSLSAPMLAASSAILMSQSTRGYVEIIRALKNNGTNLRGKEVYHPQTGVTLIDQIIGNPVVLNIKKALESLSQSLMAFSMN